MKCKLLRKRKWLSWNGHWKNGIRIIPIKLRLLRSNSRLSSIKDIWSSVDYYTFRTPHFKFCASIRTTDIANKRKSSVHHGDENCAQVLEKLETAIPWAPNLVAENWEKPRAHVNAPQGGSGENAKESTWEWRGQINCLFIEEAVARWAQLYCLLSRTFDTGKGSGVVRCHLEESMSDKIKDKTVLN